MNYAQLRKYDVANGPGVRVTLFVSGCTHKCKGCFQPETWNFSYGKKFTKETEDLIIKYLNNKNVKGFSLLGGDPCDQDQSILDLLIRIKRETNKSIWTWTGYDFCEIINQDISDKQNFIQKEIIRLSDVVIDGKFEEDKKDLNLKYRGSRNQRVIDVKKTIENKKIITIL